VEAVRYVALAAAIRLLLFVSVAFAIVEQVKKLIREVKTNNKFTEKWTFAMNDLFWITHHYDDVSL